MTRIYAGPSAFSPPRQSTSRRASALDSGLVDVAAPAVATAESDDGGRLSSG
jgi:hypothetical protein